MAISVRRKIDLPKERRPDGLEFSFFSGSPFLHKTVEEFEKEFDVKCDHYHNSPINRNTKVECEPDKELVPGITLHVYGKSEAIVNLLGVLSP